MSDTHAKIQILKNIRQALAISVPMPFPEVEGNQDPIYQINEKDIAILFAQKFGAIGGKFSWCENFTELKNELTALIQIQKWKHIACWEEPIQSKLVFENLPGLSNSKEIDHADASITYCECLVARTGSAFLSSKQGAGRQLGIYAPVHIIVASVSQVVLDIKDGFDIMHTKYGEQLPSMMCLTTGPSRTADIEKTLVVGVHGPKEIYVFLVNEPFI